MIPQKEEKENSNIYDVVVDEGNALLVTVFL